MRTSLVGPGCRSPRRRCRLPPRRSRRAAFPARNADSCRPCTASGCRKPLAARMIAAPAIASRHIHAPASTPTAAVDHRVAALLSSVTDRRCFMMTPAPRNPMPETIWPQFGWARPGSGTTPNHAEQCHRSAGRPSGTATAARRRSRRREWWRARRVPAGRSRSRHDDRTTRT